MSIQKSIEPLSEHPLFRALVLMGGALAMGCGGVVQDQDRTGADVGRAGSADGGASASALAGRPNLDVPPGGSAGTDVASAGTGAQASGGAATALIYNPTCPYAQWDCSAVAAGIACQHPLYLASNDDPTATGCTCDPARPTSIAACQPRENFVCRQAYAVYTDGLPWPDTWDSRLHVECACVPSPRPTFDNCGVTCAQAFPPSSSESRPMQCELHDVVTCDEKGVCTATSADVLRQDGIMCGCADIGLK